MTAPTLRTERTLIKTGHATVVGIDEVGRGSLAGPVSVGAVVVDSSVMATLTGVRDSKDLTHNARIALVPRIHAWCLDSAVGHASPAEIDELGIIGALRLAGHRAVEQLRTAPAVVLLDGSHDWFSRPEQPSLLDLSADLLDDVPPVVTKVKADATCMSVSAASVLAKVARDAIMARIAADFPAYGWADNKGYASPDHIAALTALGPTAQHRRSWNLPGVTR